MAELIGDRSGDLKAPEGGDWDVCIDNPTSLPAWVRDAASVLKRWRRKPDSNFSSLSRQFLRAGGAVRGNQMAGPEESFSVPGPLVRIHLPPAVSQQTFGSSQGDAPLFD